MTREATMTRSDVVVVVLALVLGACAATTAPAPDAGGACKGEDAPECPSGYECDVARDVCVPEGTAAPCWLHDAGVWGACHDAR